jgi:hypothetical protein
MARAEGRTAVDAPVLRDASSADRRVRLGRDAHPQASGLTVSGQASVGQGFQRRRVSAPAEVPGAVAVARPDAPLDDVETPAGTVVASSLHCHCRIRCVFLTRDLAMSTWRGAASGTNRFLSGLKALTM